MLLAAKWILPITEPPIRDGVIAIEGRHIEAVMLSHESDRDDAEDLGDVILVPGLINAHTHLELGCLPPSPHRPEDLVDWLLRVIASQHELKRETLKEQTATTVTKGIAASLAAGVTTVGDITRFSDLTRPILRCGPLNVVSFGEVLGIGKSRRQVDERLRLAADSQHDSEYLATALSPHAPYSIEAAGIERVVSYAREHDMRTCIHLAESIEEIQFLETGRGRFRELLERIGVWDDAIPIPRTTPVRWLCDLGALGPECVIAHGNYLDEEEIDLLCATGTSVAYCPRTHQYFDHQRHPVVQLLSGGVNVCVGTDSLASNPSLSVLEELVFLREWYPELSLEVILSMATINGARALGVAQRVGSLEPGKQADLAVFSCSDEPASHPLHALLCGSATLQRLYIAGERIR